MATKIIKAWVDGVVQEIEVEDMTSPEQMLSPEERLDILEDKPIITDGNLLVGNGTDELDQMTPEEVLSHINGASVMTMTTEEYNALGDEESNANTLYVLTDSEECGSATYIVNIVQNDDGTYSVDDSFNWDDMVAAYENGAQVMCKRRISDTTLFYDSRYYLSSLDTEEYNAYFMNADASGVEEIQLLNGDSNVTFVRTTIDIDDSLTHDNRPADAKAVGDKFVELESSLKTITDLLIDANLAPVITDDEGAIIAESDGTILLNL